MNSTFEGISPKITFPINHIEMNISMIILPLRKILIEFPVQFIDNESQYYSYWIDSIMIIRNMVI